LLQCAEIDLFGRDFDAFLGQKNADAARIRGAAAIVEFHRPYLSIGATLPRRN
jgi:hypothetical protein